MTKKKDFSERKETKEIKFEKTFYFPRQNKTVRASNLEEATKIVTK